MATNDVIILEKVLEQRKAEIAPELSASDFFEIFTAEQLLKSFDLSYDEIKSGITGGGGDGGIDSAYLLVNGELIQEDTDISGLKKGISIDLILIQAKTGTGFGESAMDKFVSISKDILDFSVDVAELSKVYNSSLLGLIKKFRNVYERLAARFPNLTISYFYATKGDQPHQNVERKIENIKRIVKELFSSAKCNFTFVGASKLLELARLSPRSSYFLKLAENAISSENDAGFICLVKLRDFYSFITGEDGKLIRGLFEANVRDYQGSTEVNDAIQKTLREPSNEDFWWLNNGITILASKATQNSKIVTIEDPQIVNGLQTSTEIYKYFADRKNQEDERQVLVRVVVPPVAESRDRIIKATNSQTTIPVASLRATERIHRDIEDYFGPYGLYYDRRKNFYKNEGRPIDKIISISQLAQAVMAIKLLRPDDARARPSSLLKKNEDYKLVFNPDYPIETYFFCVALMKKVEVFLKSGTANLEEKDRTNLRFYIGMYAACLLTRKAVPHSNDLTRQLIPLANDNIFLDCLAAIKPIYDELGATEQVAKGTELVERLKKNLIERFNRNEIAPSENNTLVGD